MRATANGRNGRLSAWIGAVLAAWTVSTVACGGVEDDIVAEADTSSTVQAVRNAPSSSAARWSVKLEMGGGLCTGSALTRHWILTAAHCVHRDPNPQNVKVTYVAPGGTEQVVYDDPATYYMHPDYDPIFDRWGALLFWDSANDVALIRLNGTGMTRFEATKLYVDSKDPWLFSSTFAVSGFGRGNNGGSGSCPTTPGTKRTGNFNHETAPPYTTRGRNRPFGQETCRGDSGSGWYVRLDGHEMAFGVMSTSDAHDACGCNYPLSGFTGARIRPKMNWIVSTTRSTHTPIRCTEDRALHRQTIRTPWGWPIEVRLASYRFQTCTEDIPDPPPPPPPPPPTERTCANQGGYCSNGPCTGGWISSPSSDCAKPRPVCCVQLLH